MSKWSFKEDFKMTDWKATLIYNLQRAAAAGIVAIIVSLFLGEKLNILYFLLAPIVWPLVYIAILLPLGLVAAWLSDQGVPIIGLITAICSFYVFVGDPLVWFADIVLPSGFIPVEKVKFINFALIVYVMKPEPGELDESMEVSTFDSVPSADIQPDSKLVQPLNISQRTEAGPGTPGLEQGPGYAESVMTKSLIDQAVLLEARGDKESIENAHILWEQALKIGGLSASDDLLCHYYLGPYYQSKENLAEAIKHNERIAISDPNLTFLNESDETVRILLRADLYKSLSAAYQYHARTAIKEHEGLMSAIGYIESKLGIIGSMAAPSLFLELGSYYGLAGDSGKAKETLERALEAPSYGSEFQEAAKKSASDFLKEEAAAKETINNRDDISKAEKPLIPDTEAAARRSPAMKWAVGGILGIAAVFVIFLFLMPSQYKEYFKKAQEAFNKGNYLEALTLVSLAKEKKATTELVNLEAAVQKNIREMEARAEEQKRQREYDDYFQRARRAYEQQNFAEAENYAQLASGRKATQEVSILRSKIGAARRRLEEAERQNAMNTADDAAYQIARQLNTRVGYLEYMYAYPDGRNKSAALTQLAALREKSAQEQRSVQTSPVPIPQYSEAAKSAVPQTQDSRAELRNELEKALGYLEQRTTPSAPYISNNQEQRWTRQAWKQAVANNLNSAGTLLNKALGIAQRTSNRETQNLIAKWGRGVKQARTQVMGISSLGEEASYRIQKTIIKEIKNYLAR